MYVKPTLTKPLVKEEAMFCNPVSKPCEPNPPKIVPDERPKILSNLASGELIVFLRLLYVSALLPVFLSNRPKTRNLLGAIEGRIIKQLTRFKKRNKKHKNCNNELHYGKNSLQHQGFCCIYHSKLDRL
uniref:Uncharacterized protein n=1 Tax=Romanomermis culicivorax TaxID=13658 RepID=A0A915J6E1_ROMCU